MQHLMFIQLYYASHAKKTFLLISDNSNLVLAVCLSTGHIFLMKSYDDVSPIQFNTGLGGPLCMEWSNSRQLLAVAGVANHTDSNDYLNMLKCYTDTGVLLYSTTIPYTLVS